MTEICINCLVECVDRKHYTVCPKCKFIDGDKIEMSRGQWVDLKRSIEDHQKQRDERLLNDLTEKIVRVYQLGNPAFVKKMLKKIFTKNG
jgi:hypothetical protein